MKRIALLAAAVALPMSLVTAMPAQATTDSVDLLFEAIPPWCAPGVCNVPSDEPTVTQGTVVKATSLTPWLGNHVAALYAELVIPGGTSQAIPSGSYAYSSNTFDVGQDYVTAQVPTALNWTVEQALKQGVDWPYLEIDGNSDGVPGPIDMITRIPVRLIPRTQPVATMPAGSPRTVAGARTGQGAAKISWSAPTAPKGKSIVGYRVARNGVDSYGGGAYAKTLGASVRSFTMHYLVLGATYTLSVQALYSGGTKSATATVPVFIG